MEDRVRLIPRIECNRCLGSSGAAILPEGAIAKTMALLDLTAPSWRSLPPVTEDRRRIIRTHLHSQAKFVPGTDAQRSSDTHPAASVRLAGADGIPVWLDRSLLSHAKHGRPAAMTLQACALRPRALSGPLAPSAGVKSTKFKLSPSGLNYCRLKSIMAMHAS